MILSKDLNECNLNIHKNANINLNAFKLLHFGFKILKDLIIDIELRI